MLMWKTQMWEKPRQPTDCRKSLCENYNDGETQRQRPLAPPSSPHGGYNRGNDLFFSLTPLSIHRFSLFTHNITIMFNNINCFYPKSYLYTYDFRTIYTYGPKGLTRTHSHMCPFQPVGRITTGS